MRKIFYLINTGIVLGIVTSFGQTYLPEPTKQFANSFSVWLLASFIFGMFTTSRKQAFVSGASIQILALISYYVTTDIRFSSGYGSKFTVLFWLIGGVTMGPFLAAAGRIYHRHSKGSVLAVAAMSSVILLEALYMLVGLHYVRESLCFLLLAMVFVIITLFYQYKPTVKPDIESGARF